MRICIPELSGGSALQLSVLLVLQGSATQRKWNMYYACSQYVFKFWSIEKWRSLVEVTAKVEGLTCRFVFFYEWHIVTIRREYRLNVVWLGGRCAEGTVLASRQETEGKKINEYWGLAGKSEGKIPLWRSRNRWWMGLKCILK